MGNVQRPPGMAIVYHHNIVGDQRCFLNAINQDIRLVFSNYNNRNRNHLIFILSACDGRVSVYYIVPLCGDGCLTEINFVNWFWFTVHGSIDHGSRASRSYTIEKAA